MLPIVRGDTLAALTCEFGVTPGKLAQWRDKALVAVRAGLQSREPDHRDGFLHDLKAKAGDQATLIEVLEKRNEIPEDGLLPPLRRPTL